MRLRQAAEEGYRAAHEARHLLGLLRGLYAEYRKQGYVKVDFGLKGWRLFDLRIHLPGEKAGERE